MNDAPIRYFNDGPIARIVLNRPERHNALGADEIRQLHDRLAAIEEDSDIRVLLLSGSGERTFCAGASLTEFHSGDMSAGLFTTLTDRLARLRVPSVCALNGSVYGGGAEIALCCDYRIGVSGSRLLVPAARIGLCYPLNGLQRYVDTLGLSVAKRILVASEELDAATLLAIGFLHRVVPPAALQAESEAFAIHLAGLAPLAVQAMKRILGGIVDGSMDPAEATRLVNACTGSADLREGLAAQRERRVAQFSGS